MPLKILVAEDSVTMRAILQMTFAGEDAEVTVVEDGDAAVVKAAEIRPDVVIVDSTLSPDGYEVVKSIKSITNMSHLRVMLLSSQQAPYDETRGRSVGVDEHMVKPFETQRMIDRVKRMAVGSPSLPPPARPASASTTSPSTPPATFAPTSLTPAVDSDFDSIEDRASIVMTTRPRQSSPPVAAVPSAPRAPSAPSIAQPHFAAMDAKLDGLGLTQDQIAAVSALSREVVERVVWEVVPQLAETIIREEIKRLTAE